MDEDAVSFIIEGSHQGVKNLIVLISLPRKASINLASGRHMEVCIPMPTRSDATGDKHAFLVMAHKDNEVLHTLPRQRYKVKAAYVQ